MSNIHQNVTGNNNIFSTTGNVVVNRTLSPELEKVLLNQLHPPLLASSIPSSIPYSGAVKFVGRTQELEILHQQLQKTDHVVISAIAGMGGIGKTELAIQYALLHKDDYQGGICWLPSSRQDLNIGVQIVTFARTQLRVNLPDNLKSPEEQVAFCWQHWPVGQVLIVLDNVTDYKYVRPYLPPQEPRFKVLITTRLKMGKPIAQIELDVLDKSSALKLLESHIGKERIQPERELAEKLCAWLGFLPLGLELVGRYLALNEDLSLEKMQKRLDSKRLEQIALQEPMPEMTAQLGVAAAFELSWDGINDDAKQLGCLLSLFAPAPIRWELVERVFPTREPEDLERIRDKNLRHLHLLQRKGQGIYQLHTLVREFLQTKLEKLPQANDLKQTFAKEMVTLTKQMFESPQKEQFEKLPVDIFHLEEVAQNLITELSDEDFLAPFLGVTTFYLLQGLLVKSESWCQKWLSVTRSRFKDDDFSEENPSLVLSLMFLGIIYQIQDRTSEAKSCFSEIRGILKTLQQEVSNPSFKGMLGYYSAILFFMQGKYDEVESLSTDLLETIRLGLGEKHPLVFQYLTNQAVSHAKQGHYNKAENILQQALELYQCLSNYDISVPSSLINIAEVYYNQNKYDKAESIYKQALEISKHLFGDKHIIVVGTLNRLGELYRFQKCYKEAESFYQQALHISKQLADDSPLSVAISLNNLARFWEEQQLYNNAESLYQQVLDIRKQVFSDNHTTVAESLTDLGNLYSLQARYSEAKPFYVKALEIRKHLLGDNHIEVAVSFNNLALIYYNEKDYKKAEPLYIYSLEIYKRLLGNNHIDTAVSMRNLAHLYYNQKDYEKAEPLYIHSLEIRKRLLGDHIDVAVSLSDLANLYYDQKGYEKAEPLYIQALEIRKRLLGGNHIDVTVSLTNLANLYYNQRYYEKAEPLYIQALEIRKRLLGGNHIDMTVSLTNLANLYYNQRYYEKAEPLYIQALEIRKRLLGDNHIDVTVSLTNLANLYYNQRYYERAEPLYIQALEIRKCLFGDNHIDVANAQKALADLYRKQKRYSDAEPLYLQSIEIIKGVLGYEHLEVADNLDNLINFYYHQGDYSKAVFFMEQVLEIHKKLLGDNHFYVFNSLNKLANLYRKQNRYGKAEFFTQQAQSIHKHLANDQQSEMLVFDTHELPNFVSLTNEAKTLLMQLFQLLENKEGKLDKKEHVEHVLKQSLKFIKSGDNDNIAVATRALANFYNLQKRYEEAEVLYLQTHKHLLEDDNHIDIAESLKELADFYFNQGRYDEAEPLYTQALKISEQFLDNNNPEIVEIISSLAELYTKQNRCGKAERILKRAIKSSKHLSNHLSNHFEIATYSLKLAELYHQQGRYSDAEHFYLKYINIQENQVSGNNHDITLFQSSLSAMVNLYVIQERFSEAEPLCKRKVELFHQYFLDKKTLKIEQLDSLNLVDMINTLLILSIIYERLGHLNEAEVSLGKAVEFSQNLQENDDPTIVRCLYQLAQCCGQNSHYHKEAEKLYLKTLKIRQKMLGKNHIEVATNLHDLAAFYRIHGRYNEAKPLFIQALDIRKHLLDDNHPDVANNMNELALLYHEQGYYSEAEPLYAQCMEINKRLYGKKSASVATLLNNLASLYRDQGHYNEAEPLYLRSLKLNQRFLKKDDPNLARCMDNLGMLYYAQGHYTKAEPLYVQALKIFEQRLRTDDPRIVRCRKNLEILRTVMKNNNFSKTENSDRKSHWYSVIPNVWHFLIKKIRSLFN